jgi:cell division protein FtsL
VPASGAGARSWLPLLLAAVVIAALGLSALRSDRIRLRYDLAQALAQERELLERERLLIVEVRKLRSPARLASFARTLGLSPPQRVVELSAQTAAR